MTRTRIEAGEAALRLEGEIRRLAPSAVHLLTGGAEIAQFRHYPDGDVYDFGSHSQFYFHSHRDHEHGHVHLFLRPKGMPPGLHPQIPAGEADAPCHLVAVGFDGDGRAAELFTTNRWVTGEAWYAAADVKAMLPHFNVAGESGPTLVGAWLSALLILYRPLIERLVDDRDRAVARWSARHPNTDPLEDARLELTSRAAIDVARDLEWLRAGG